MFSELLKNLRELGRTRITIKADGEYPTKYKTPVQHVAKYQNDGTDRGVKPSRFVERAEKQHRGWKSERDKATADFLAEGNSYPIEQLGKKIAHDISVMVDRIKTGLLKRSFRAHISKK